MDRVGAYVSWICVLDASVVVRSILSPGEPYARDVVASLRFHSALVPSLWWLEITNALLLAERQKVCSAETADLFLEGIMQMRIGTEPTAGNVAAAMAVHRLARRHQISTYDATYLDLALQYELPLATLDRRLKDAAAAEGVALFRPESVG